MFVMTGSDSEGNARRLSVGKKSGGAVLRLYEPAYGAGFESDMEGRIIGEIILNASDVAALEVNL